MATSVVIPCYNGERYLSECLRSVLAAGANGAVVVDDCSTDSTPQILEQLTRRLGDWLRVIRMKANSGAAAARNAGYISAAQNAKYVFFLDVDDLLFPGAINRLEKYLGRAPQEVGMACGALQLVSPQLVPLQNIFHPVWAPQLVPYWFLPYGGNFLISTWAGNKTCAHYGSLYSEGLKTLSENTLLWCKMHHIGCRALVAPFLTVKYRQHKAGSGSTYLTEAQDPRETVWENFQRLGYDPDFPRAVCGLMKIKVFHPEYGVNPQYLGALFSKRWFPSYITAVFKFEQELLRLQGRGSYWQREIDVFRALKDAQEQTFESVAHLLLK